MSAKLPAELSFPPEGEWHWCGTLVSSPMVSALVCTGTNCWAPGLSSLRQSGFVKSVTFASPSTSMTFVFISCSVELLDEDDEELAFEDVDDDDEEDQEDQEDEEDDSSYFGHWWLFLRCPDCPHAEQTGAMRAFFFGGGLLIWRATSCYFYWYFSKTMPNKRQMVDREDETGSSPDFEELEVRPNLADSENCGVVG